MFYVQFEEAKLEVEVKLLVKASQKFHLKTNMHTIMEVFWSRVETFPIGKHLFIYKQTWSLNIWKKTFKYSIKKDMMVVGTKAPPSWSYVLSTLLDTRVLNTHLWNVALNKLIDQMVEGGIPWQIDIKMLEGFVAHA